MGLVEDVYNYLSRITNSNSDQFDYGVHVHTEHNAYFAFRADGGKRDPIEYWNAAKAYTALNFLGFMKEFSFGSSWKPNKLIKLIDDKDARIIDLALNVGRGAHIDFKVSASILEDISRRLKMSHGEFYIGSLESH